MTVELMTPVRLGESRYRVVAEITDFDAAAGLRGELTIVNGGMQQVIPIEATGSRIEVDTATLAAFQRSDASIVLRGAEIRTLRDQLTWTTGPPDVATMTATVGDAGTITLTGHGLGMPIGMRLGIRATPDADETVMQLFNFTQQGDTCTAVVPVLLSTDQARTFPGIVPPSRVYLAYFNGDGMVDVPAGTTQLAYRSSRPIPASGAAGSTFDLQLFHPARAPDLAGVTVLFDDAALAPQSVQELGDITAGGFIYLTRSQFRVPAGATPGVHRVTARTSFGEVMLSNGPDFTVVAPAQ